MSLLTGKVQFPSISMEFIRETFKFLVLIQIRTIIKWASLCSKKYYYEISMFNQNYYFFFFFCSFPDIKSCEAHFKYK